MITFGLTGGIACGKSTVTKTFRSNGIPIVDADIVARQVVEPGTIGSHLIQKAFGNEFFTDNGALNRVKLGNLVFQDKISMKKLNDIMGPLIQGESAHQIHMWAQYLYGELGGGMENPSAINKIIVGYDAALIIEMGNAKRYRPLIVVNCPFEIQIERLIKRNNLTYEQAKARIDAQMPLSEKVKLADYVIDTSGTIENSAKQTLEIIHKLKAM